MRLSLAWALAGALALPGIAGADPLAAARASDGEDAPVEPDRPLFALSVGMGFSPEGFTTAPVGSTASERPSSLSFLFDGEIMGRSGLGFLGRMVGLGGEEDKRIGYDRVVATGALEVRPLTLAGIAASDFAARALRRVAGEVGLAYERVNSGANDTYRIGLHLGLHADLPLGGVGDRGLFLRLGVARRIGFAGRDEIKNLPICPAMVSQCPVSDTALDLHALVGASF